jgi:hypothetical protein
MGCLFFSAGFRQLSEPVILARSDSLAFSYLDPGTPVAHCPLHRLGLAIRTQSKESLS